MGTEHKATYTNLDPGTYIFKVKGANNSGVWNEEGASIEVVISPPFWATWWFRWLLSVLVLGGLVWAYSRRVRGFEERQRELKIQVADRTKALNVSNQALSASNEALNTINEELNISNQQLEAKNDDLERFSYTVSHDLKSPLFTIKGFAGLLEKDIAAGKTEQVKVYLEYINAGANKMQRLLDDLLHLSRVGRPAHPPETISLTELANEAIFLVAGHLAERNVEVVILPDLPVVFGDRGQLTEVFQNLIANAVRYMGDQVHPHIEIGSRPDETGVVCYVKDNGVGIEPQYHEKVFELFERFNTETEGTGSGAGAG